MIFTIRSLIVPTLRVGGRSDAACASAPASAIEMARIFIREFYLLVGSTVQEVQLFKGLRCRIRPGGPRDPTVIARCCNGCRRRLARYERPSSATGCSRGDEARRLQGRR